MVSQFWMPRRPRYFRQFGPRYPQKVIVWKALAAFLCSLSLSALGQERNRAPRIYAWESVGTISSRSKKIISVRCVLRLSESSWSLLPGAVSQISQLQEGDQILAEGHSDSRGWFSTRRIYHILPTPRAAGNGPEPGLEDQPGRPGGSSPPADPQAGPTPGTQAPPVDRPDASGGSARLPDYSRFEPGDVIGTILELEPEQLVVSRRFLLTNETSILDPTGKTTKRKSLHPGTRVAVTVVDAVDRKTQAVKASVIRLLP